MKFKDLLGTHYKRMQSEALNHIRGAKVEDLQFYIDPKKGSEDYKSGLNEKLENLLFVLPSLDKNSRIDYDNFGEHFNKDKFLPKKSKSSKIYTWKPKIGIMGSVEVFNILAEGLFNTYPPQEIVIDSGYTIWLLIPKPDRNELNIIVLAEINIQENDKLRVEVEQEIKKYLKKIEYALDEKKAEVNETNKELKKYFLNKVEEEIHKRSKKEEAGKKTDFFS